jgi:hypothetical protein
LKRVAWACLHVLILNSVCYLFSSLVAFVADAVTTAATATATYDTFIHSQEALQTQASAVTVQHLQQLMTQHCVPALRAELLADTGLDTDVTAPSLAEATTVFERALLARKPVLRPDSSHDLQQATPTAASTNSSATSGQQPRVHRKRSPKAAASVALAVQRSHKSSKASTADTSSSATASATAVAAGGGADAARALAQSRTAVASAVTSSRQNRSRSSSTSSSSSSDEPPLQSKGSVEQLRAASPSNAATAAAGSTTVGRTAAAAAGAAGAATADSDSGSDMSEASAYSHADANSDSDSDSERPVLTPSASSVRLAGQSPPAPTTAAAAAAVLNESAEAKEQRLAEAAAQAAARAVRAGEREDISKAQVSYCEQSNLYTIMLLALLYCRTK